MVARDCDILLHGRSWKFHPNIQQLLLNLFSLPSNHTSIRIKCNWPSIWVGNHGIKCYNWSSFSLQFLLAWQDKVWLCWSHFLARTMKHYLKLFFTKIKSPWYVDIQNNETSLSASGTIMEFTILLIPVVSVVPIAPAVTVSTFQRLSLQIKASLLGSSIGRNKYLWQRSTVKVKINKHMNAIKSLRLTIEM